MAISERNIWQVASKGQESLVKSGSVPDLQRITKHEEETEATPDKFCLSGGGLMGLMNMFGGGGGVWHPIRELMRARLLHEMCNRISNMLRPSTMAFSIAFLGPATRGATFDAKTYICMSSRYQSRRSSYDQSAFQVPRPGGSQSI